MPLLLSNGSEFCSKYYLSNGSFPNKCVEQHDDDKRLNWQPKFQQCVDIERLKTYPKIVFLGTVSASASLERNHTSILIDMA